jgi:hypothetical protein
MQNIPVVRLWVYLLGEGRIPVSSSSYYASAKTLIRIPCTLPLAETTMLTAVPSQTTCFYKVGRTAPRSQELYLVR